MSKTKKGNKGPDKELEKLKNEGKIDDFRGSSSLDKEGNEVVRNERKIVLHKPLSEASEYLTALCAKYLKNPNDVTFFIQHRAEWNKDDVSIVVIEKVTDVSPDELFRG